ncbi:glycoside hydrolase [Bimuria novae-zelandiae CBS 107.79]|uniref:Glycoside hydrolase n=1 Tax=Bimuria novae-zelandiae CBS 107.79 TaxID=1447943 RepID=A0A6A5VRI2_9PLEO|nr:glycoside hydrolase [Bimuria novae-zelandiae CBS 107.79]
MRLHATVAYALATTYYVASATPTGKPDERDLMFDWSSNTDKIRGVNIGGWLVLEPFITPSIFLEHSSDNWPVKDEWTLCEKIGREECKKALKAHWDSFVTLGDFKRIKKAGFNVIRIPVGYWSFMDIEWAYVDGAAPYLDKAIKWARKTGLKVIVDFHGAPKSQNGFDHSGHYMEWPQWGEGDSIPNTHKVLKIIEEKYAKDSMRDVVMAIQPLNEPFLVKLDDNMVKQFYRDSYYNLRLISSDMPMMIHDGFERPSWLNNFLTPSDNNAQNVIVDHHEYQIFNTTEVARSTDEHRQAVCQAADYWADSDKWMVVGEWSGAMTDCAPHLNGFQAGNRHEGSFAGSWWMGPCWGGESNLSGEVKYWSYHWKDEVRKYIETQLEAFEAKAKGWIFWNFKTEGSAGEWDLFQLLDNGVFPQPLTDRKFGKYCTNF